MKTPRLNTPTSLAIDEAATAPNVRAAARFLTQHGVAFRTICRALMGPARRRAVDLPPAIS